MPNNPQNNKQQEETITAGDDMDKAETFGFGYHHYYSYPAYYYPSYYYGYYPSYYYGYYCGIEERSRQDGLTKRDTVAVANDQENEAAAIESAVESSQDDMDKAETFGFGYRRYIHFYPRYYPRYYYGSYYPRYYYGYYGHYW
uniref:Uncharacterized protein n=1 Tax=Anopheles coluzzii TaxID=1518534 RepID=A0A8W7PGP2_ANOCL